MARHKSGVNDILKRTKRKTENKSNLTFEFHQEQSNSLRQHCIKTKITTARQLYICTL